MCTEYFCCIGLSIVSRDTEIGRANMYDVASCGGHGNERVFGSYSYFLCIFCL